MQLNEIPDAPSKEVKSKEDKDVETDENIWMEAFYLLNEAVDSLDTARKHIAEVSHSNKSRNVVNDLKSLIADIELFTERM